MIKNIYNEKHEAGTGINQKTKIEPKISMKKIDRHE